LVVASGPDASDRLDPESLSTDHTGHAGYHQSHARGGIRQQESHGAACETGDQGLVYTKIAPILLITTSPPGYDPAELVKLKDANGRLQDYAETEYTRTLRRQLKGINRINGTTEIRFKRYRVQTQLHAVYKQDFTQGGRLYTSGSVHLQGLKGSERRQLTINGEPVVELDYSGYHPCLLYAEEGIQFEGDPYDLGTVTEHPIARKFAKTAFHALLNADSWRKAEKAVNHWAYQHPAAVPTLKRLGLYPARQVLLPMERRHQPIRHHFSSGSGLRLMNLEAKIALGVVRHFTDQGTPCLPVHDSFLVQERYESALRQVMLNAYKQYSNGFKILITKK